MDVFARFMATGKWSVHSIEFSQEQVIIVAKFVHEGLPSISTSPKQSVFFVWQRYNSTMYKNSLGVIKKGGHIDYVYRVALRALIRNEKGEILIVKERGRDWWNLPGGGLDYGEGIKEGLARELKEEIGLSGDFDYHILTLQTPTWNERLGVMQINAIFEVIPNKLEVSLGVDGCELDFRSIDTIYKSNPADSKICSQLKSALPCCGVMDGKFTDLSTERD